MPSKTERGVLQVDTSEWIDELLYEGACSGIPKWRYFELSRERNGHEEHWTVRAITDLRSLPRDVAAAILARLNDEFEDAHDPVDVSEIPALQVAEQEADGEEDVAGIFAARDAAKYHLHLDRLERLEPIQRRLRMAYRKGIREAARGAKKPARHARRARREQAGAA